MNDDMKNLLSSLSVIFAIIFILISSGSILNDNWVVFFNLVFIFNFGIFLFLIAR